MWETMKCFTLHESIHEMVLKVYVKYMVSSRCSIKISQELEEKGIVMPEISQGMLKFQEELDGLQLLQLKEVLLDLGFEVLDELESDLMDSISQTIEKLIYEQPEIALEEYPFIVKNGLGGDHLNMMLVFSLVYGVDLIQYAVVQQVERIKEMILYEGRPSEEIVKLFQFKNEDQLNRNFQKITGLKPSYYEKIRNKRLEVQNRIASAVE